MSGVSDAGLHCRLDTLASLSPRAPSTFACCQFRIQQSGCVGRSSVRPGCVCSSAAGSGPAQIAPVMTRTIVGGFVGVYQFSTLPTHRVLSQGVQGTDAFQDLFWAVRGALY
ncbi:hypothetical protein NDU88_004233 [Pleurodeles waltl]|uniref:Uncharacterized protein n=1 Tax=Pleurodeles waltl TaxID=8319 RepID=A0AAV7NMV2_PLEWA|nr:hypothetical protein NDU88_004233 [Pleurodeles waltl]